MININESHIPSESRYIVLKKEESKLNQYLHNSSWRVQLPHSSGEWDHEQKCRYAVHAKVEVQIDMLFIIGRRLPFAGSSVGGFLRCVTCMVQFLRLEFGLIGSLLARDIIFRSGVGSKFRGRCVGSRFAITLKGRKEATSEQGYY